MMIWFTNAYKVHQAKKLSIALQMTCLYTLLIFVFLRKSMCCFSGQMRHGDKNKKTSKYIGRKHLLIPTDTLNKLTIQSPSPYTYKRQSIPPNYNGAKL